MHPLTSPKPSPRFRHGLIFVLALVAGNFAVMGSVVTIGKGADGHFILLRDGVPFFINGAGGEQHLDVLAANGGNSIRTWGIDQLEKMVDGKPLIDRANDLGLTVTAGLWVGHERHGFNYSDPAMLNKQRDSIRAAVRKYKDAPALLIWGLGNEMEGPISTAGNPLIWKELNVLAGIIKAEDPHHPVMTVIAGASAAKVQGILENYPNIDILGVNAYAGASGVGKAVVEAGWKKPFILTEFGPLGAWEVPKTSWGAPIEPSSREKAGSYYASETGVVEDSKDICLGSYVFLWGQKQEVTSTWYGMFLKTGEKLPTVDAIVRAWTGKWPADRCPKVLSFTSPLKEAVVGPAQSTTASVTTEEAGGSPLQYEWAVTEESSDRKVGGDAESEPPSYPECIVSSANGEATIKTPSKPGAYRLFVTVRNAKGGASKDNMPFLVKQ